jgi:dATP pyrophosphohydrolase
LINNSVFVESHLLKKVENDIEFLLLKRAPGEIYPDIWQMVTGKINDDEKAYETAIREIKEETGLSPEKLWVVPNVNSFYSPKHDKVLQIPVFAALINDDTVKLSEEHSEYKWVKKEEAKKLLAWPGQRNSVDIIYEYFLHEKLFFELVEIKEF